MNIAFSIATDTHSNKNFIPEIFSRITKSYSEHTFILISGKPLENSDKFSSNIIPVIIEYEATSPVKWFIWHNIKIPKVLKKYKAHIFISDNFCSLATKIPQILVAPDLDFIHQPNFINKKKRLFYRKFIPRFFKKAELIIAHSEYEKKEIIKNFKLNANKIKVIYSGANENCKLVTIEERERVKEKYTDGNEYFIYPGLISPQKNLMNLLKGFSAFKKRQRSSMQLIIAGQPGRKYKEFIESLRLYRFKKEVKLLENISQEEMMKISASAYAMIYPAIYETTANEMIESMKCRVPAITSDAGAMPEIGGEAALYFDPGNHKSIAENLMLIFKDEKLRKELIEKGNAQTNKFSWEESSLALWKSIEAIIA
ncbi:MAG: glycosyltransferase family 1 protein [Bacteroidota bacterium]|nr:glycosyltransferase family 1 protein [Bacteroidota bacterium]